MMKGLMSVIASAQEKEAGGGGEATAPEARQQEPAPEAGQQDETVLNRKDSKLVAGQV